MLWLLLLALLVAVLFGLGFVVKWLFIVAAIVALVWVIAFFAGASGHEPDTHGTAEKPAHDRVPGGVAGDEPAALVNARVWPAPHRGTTGLICPCCFLTEGGPTRMRSSARLRRRPRAVGGCGLEPS